MNNQSVGQELSQSARLLFNRAARDWYWSASLEFSAGIGAALIAVLASPPWDIWGAAVTTALLIVAYLLRVRFDSYYELAETMRRQSVFSEALDWPVDSWQLSEWRRILGKRLRAEVKTNPRNADYYATTSPTGPARLAGMTRESAFYTRNLYINLRRWLYAVLGVALIFVGVVLITALTDTIPKSVDVLLARFLLSAIPVVLSVDVLGWMLRLNRLIEALSNVEAGLRRVGTNNINNRKIHEPEVLRLASEYNCQVSGGFPIPNALFRRWHDDIEELWKEDTP